MKPISKPPIEMLFILLGLATALPIILLVIAQIGGWSQLAQAYRASKRLRGKAWRFQSMTLGRWTGYKWIVTLGSNPEGIHFSLLYPFSIGHPALFIPWSDLDINPDQGGRTLLRLKRFPELWVEMKTNLLKELRAAADQ